MVKHNLNITKLQSSYLFPEVLRRKAAFLREHPKADLISLSIGDTTEPIPKMVANAMRKAAEQLATKKGYNGYGPEKGLPKLREKIASDLYHHRVEAEDIFINDGAKCDIGRLQAFFGPHVKVALQDPAYPVYIDGSVIAGQTGEFNLNIKSYEQLVLLSCTPENNFFPDLSTVGDVDLIYFCSPHNPTGAVATYEQLKSLVRFAQEKNAIILYDSAYAHYIQDPALPKSIYEIEGADQVAIEVGSFSKLAGFTGIRLGWTVIPKALKFDDGSSVQDLWYRFLCTIYNGASNIAQYGGLASLSPEGRPLIQQTIQYYLDNARILKEALEKKFTTHGDLNAPYIWTYCGDQDSWDYFNHFLHKAHLVTVPGSGFGNEGRGYIRISSFGPREHIEKAAERILKL